MCTNRLVQHGLQVRLQLFKTQNKGWGIRCLDDIAKGSFVCIYAGRAEASAAGGSGAEPEAQRKPSSAPSGAAALGCRCGWKLALLFCRPGKILTDDFADKEGLEMGDEYFANLDHIESVENFKEGYESDAKCSSDSSGVDLKDDEEDNTGTEEQEESNEDSSDDNFCKDEGFNASSVWRSYATRRQTRGQKENGLSETASKDSGLTPQVGHDEAAAAASCKLPVSEETSKNKVASWLSSNSVSDSFQDNDSTSSFKMSEGGEAKGCRADAALGGAEGEAKAPRKDVSWGAQPRGGGVSVLCAHPLPRGGDLEPRWRVGGKWALLGQPQRQGGVFILCVSSFCRNLKIQAKSRGKVPSILFSCCLLLLFLSKFALQ